MSSSEITLFRGDDVTFTVQVNDNSNTGIDITGCALFFSVKVNSTDSDTDALISKKVTSHTDPTAGTTAISLSATDLNIKPGTYYYDFQLVDTGGLVTTYSVGRFIIMQDITNRVT